MVHKTTAPEQPGSSDLPDILQQGAAVLSRRADEVTELADPALHQLADTLLRSVSAASGVGIAAPQIGVPLRVIVIASRPNPRYPSAPLMEPTVMINPVITARSAETISDWEGCLSVKGLRGLVPRAKSLELSYLSRDGRQVSGQFSDFVARIIQHECDHLDGLCFTDRITDPANLLSEQAYMEHRENQASKVKQ